MDEYLRFLDGTNKRKVSKPIIEIGVHQALMEISWDEDSFHARGGLYEWSRSNRQESCGGALEGIDMKDLEF